MKSRGFVFATAACTAVLAALSLYVFRHHEQDARLDAGKSLQAVSEIKAHQLAAWRQARLADARLLMGSPYFVAAAAQWLTQPGPADTATMRKRLLASKDHGQYSDVYIADGGGNVLLSTSGSTGRGPEEVRLLLDQAFREKAPVLTDLYAGPEGLGVQLATLAPLDLTGTPAAHLRAAVVLQISAATSIYPLLESWPYPSTSSETLMARRTEIPCCICPICGFRRARP